jgi:hypothetical protein
MSTASPEIATAAVDLDGSLWVQIRDAAHLHKINPQKKPAVSCWRRAKVS